MAAGADDLVSQVLNFLTSSHQAVNQTPAYFQRQIAPNGKGGTTSRWAPTAVGPGNGPVGGAVSGKVVLPSSATFNLANGKTETKGGSPITNENIAKLDAQYKAQTAESPSQQIKAGQVKHFGPFLGGIIGGVSDATGASAGEDLVGQKQNPDQAPTNAAQWALNLLSTGLYADAEATKQIGHEVNKDTSPQYLASQQKLLDTGDYSRYATNNIQSVLSPVGGYARGVAEGLGARFDGQKPATFGQDEEDIGTQKFLESKLGKSKGDLAQGALGGVSDIVGDPFTLLTLGATGALKGAVGAARDAAGEGAASVVSKTLKGAVTGAAARRAELTAERLQASINSGLRKSFKVDQKAAMKQFTPEQMDLFNTFRPEDRAAVVQDIKAGATPQDALTTEPAAVAPEVAPEAGAVEQPLTAAKIAEPAAPGEVVQPTELAPDVPVAKDAPVPSEAPAAPLITDPRYAKAQALAPTILGKTPDVAGIPDILKQATVKSAAPVAILDDARHAAINQLVKSAPTPAKWQAAVTELKRDPQTAEFLKQPATVGSVTMPVEQLARKVATGNPDSPQFARYDAALDQAYQQAKGTASQIDPAKLGAALESAPGGMIVDPQSLLGKLNSTDVAGRKTILQQALGGRLGKTYSNFDEAMRGAVQGEVEPSMMRTMLDTLGIHTKSSRPADLRRMLDGRGKTDWEAIKANVRTPQEVLTIHGVDQDALNASHSIDPEQIENSVAQHFDREIVSAVGYDATKIAPFDTTGDSVGAGVYNGQQALARIFASGEATEAFDNDALVAVHRAVMSAVAYKGTLQRLEGEARAEFVRPRYEKAMQLLETYNLGHGIMARIVDPQDTDALFVSWSQILSNMDSGAIDAAMFEPLLDRATFTSEKGISFKAGFSLYPNHIANAVRGAVRGLDAPAVAAQLAQDTLKTSPRIADTFSGWQEAVNGIAAAATDPAFLTRMRQLNDDQAPIALAFSQRVADGTVTPLSQRVMELINKAGDRGKLSEQLQQALIVARETTRSAAGYPSLAEDMTVQRMDNAFISGITGEWGSLLVASDNRAARASAIAVDAKGVVKKTRAQSGKTITTTLTKARQDGLDDADELSADAFPELQAPSDPEEERFGINSLIALRQEMPGFWRLFNRLGVAVDGHFGMKELKELMVNKMNASIVASHRYVKALRNWGTPGRNSIGTRLARDLGETQPFDYATMESKVDSWWQALAQVPKGSTDEEVERILGTGLAVNKKAGIRRPMMALAPAEIPYAMELKQFIDEIFDESGKGSFTRSMLMTKDLNQHLGAYKGFQKGGDYENAFAGNTDDSLAFQSDQWRSPDIVAAPHKLDLLSQYNSAMSSAMVLPSVMAQMSKDLAFENPTLAELADPVLQLGKLDTTKANIGRFADPDIYYPKYIRDQLPYLQQLADASRSLPALLAPTVAITDKLTNLMKENLTQLRPAHWVTNLLGDGGFNMLAGMNPLNYYRGMRAMQLSGYLASMDLGPLGDVMKLTQEAGQLLKPKFMSDYVHININGEIVPVPLGEIVTAAKRNAVLLEHSNTDDFLRGVSGTVNRTGVSKLTHATGIAQANNMLSHWAAGRDNLNRIPLFIDALEKGQFKNLEHAYTGAASTVHSWHPTTLALSNWEGKYARRMFLFYTWTRLAAERVIRTALDRPGLVTMPSKLQFEIAQANGLDPDSIGEPVNPADPNLAGYNAETLLGPTFYGGLSPLDSGTNQWGVSLSVPQIDTMQSLFEGANTTPGASNPQSAEDQATGTVQDLLFGNVTPWIGVPLQLAAGHEMTQGGSEITNPNKFVFDQVGGAVSSVLKSTGEYDKMFPPSYNPTDAKGKAEAKKEQGANNQRALLNFITGLKYLNYTSPTSAAVAAKQRQAALARATGNTIGTYGQLTPPAK